METDFAFFAPTAGWGAKQWPRDRYGAVAIALAEVGYATLVNAYRPNDPTALELVEKSLGCAVAAPSTLAQMIALERRAALVVGGDTGPIHLAMALENAGGSAIWADGSGADGDPYGRRCRVLRHTSSVVDHRRHDETEVGLQRITTDEVVEAAMKLLRESEAEARH